MIATTVDLVAALTAEGAGELAIVDGDTRLTRGELAERAREAARALMASGVQPGDAVAIWAPNSWQWVVAALATHLCGAVLVPINTRYKGDEAAYVLTRSGAVALFTVSGFLGADYPAMVAGRDLPALHTEVVMSGAASASALPWNAFLDRAAEVPRATLAARAAAVTPASVGDLMFTSGTTGAPKGVPATHGQTLRAFADWGRLVGLQRGDRYLVVAPFFHSFGYKAGWLAALLYRAVVYPLAVFDVDVVMARVARDRITVLPGPPSLYQQLLARGAGAGDHSSLRLAVTGAANVPVALVRRMATELGFTTVLTGYGLTESTGVATLCRAGDDADTVAHTSGRAMPGVEVRVVDDGGGEVDAGQPGEVVVRGYNVTAGYLDDPAATAAAIDADGWLRTGDIGVLDDRGYLRITDRKKDMFIVGGFNAYPAEIENVLMAHDAVAQVAVVGAPDERLGEVGVAFVIPRAGAEIDPAALITWSRERMANFKVPRRVEVVDALPLNAAGKVLKYELRSRVRAHAP